MGELLIIVSIGLFITAVLGYIKPAMMTMPNRKAAVGVWVMSVIVLVAGTAMLPGENQPVDTTQSSDERTPAQKGEIAAGVRCPGAVERLAQYAHRWTDGFLEPKLSRSRVTANPDIVTYIGDRVDFQNEFGAWQPHIYECDLHVPTDQVVAVRASPGRLP